MRFDLRFWVGITVSAILVLTPGWASLSQGQGLAESATNRNVEYAGSGGGFPAFLKAQKYIILSVQVDGKIAEIPYRPQDFVEEGEVLMALDDNMTQLDLKGVEAKLDMNALATQQNRVRHQYGKETLAIVEERYAKEIDGYRVASWKELKEAQEMEEIAGLQVQSSKLEGKLLETNREQYERLLDRHKVKAPVSGVLVPFTSVQQLRESNLKQPAVGETVRTGQVMVAMIKVDRLRVFRPLPVAQLDEVQLGQAARVYVEGGPPAGIEAEVIFKSPTVETTGQFHIEVEFANPRIDGPESKRSVYRYRYRDGMRARVELVQAK